MRPSQPFAKFSFGMILYLTFCLSLPSIHAYSNFDMEFIEFVLIYPSAICKMLNGSEGRCNLPNQSNFWIIHGFWKKTFSGLDPECKNFPSKFSLNEDVQNELGDRWPNIFSNRYPNKTGLWRQNYDDHGACFNETPIEYFTKAIELHKMYNIEQALKRQGIQMRNEYYKNEDIQEALSSEIAHGLYLDLNCFNDKNNQKSYLTGVRICFDAQFQPMNCLLTGSSDEAYLQACGDNIVYLPKRSNGST